MQDSPSDLFGKFTEKGYLFQSFIPASERERTAFRVVVTRQSDNKALFSYSVPMLYAPRFGVDQGDRAILEDATDKVLGCLPEAAAFSEATLSRLKTNDAVRNAGATLSQE